MATQEMELKSLKSNTTGKLLCKKCNELFERKENDIKACIHHPGMFATVSAYIF